MEIKYKTKPFEHQRKGNEVLKKHLNWALFWEQGLGKTKTVIDDIRLRYHRHKGNLQVFIFTKKMFIYNFYDELFEHSNLKPSQVSLVIKNKQAKIKALQKEAIVYLINIESLIPRKIKKSKRTDITLLNILKKKLSVKGKAFYCVIDESHCIKNRNSKATKTMISLRNYFHYKRILTGTPIGNHVGDLYTQLFFLYGHAVDHTTWTSFKNSYLITKLVERYEIVLGSKNLPYLHERLKEYVSVLKVKDTLNLPPIRTQKFYVELHPEQKKIYEKIIREKVVIIEQDIWAVLNILSENIALRQILNGITPWGELEYNAKLKAFQELFETNLSGKKIVIWVTFKQELLYLEKYFKKLKVPFGLHYGDMSTKAREEIKKKYKQEKSNFVLVTTQQSMQGSVTLLPTDIVVYLSNTFDSIMYDQTKKRTYRIGLENSILYIYIIAKATIEEKIYKALDTKIKVSNKALMGG